MSRLILLVGFAAAGCGEPQAVPPVAKTPAAPGEAPRPFAPARNLGEWESPALKELRKPPSKGQP